MTDRRTVLLVDDDPGLLQLLAMRVGAAGYEVSTCASGAEALAQIRQTLPTVVITDLRMEPMDGMALFRAIQKEWPNLPVVMLTAHGSIREAVTATQEGMFGFLTKPVDHDELQKVVAQAAELTGIEDVESDWSGQLLTRSESMFKLLEQARRLARSDINVLIGGESGTGKELLAQALHRGSSRRKQAFVAVNCSAIPEDLLESELFGHKKGAFTGATADREGLFVAADGGTLFLDEIGDMPISLQAKMLRVLQERRVRPLGATADISVNVRVLSATHQDLDEAIADKRFREDLYYRLNVASLSLPPLRDRREDIPLLAKHFLDAIAERTGQPVRQISRSGLQQLVQYHWPGNIRQLQNVIEQVVALSPGRNIPDGLISEVLPGEGVEPMVPLNDAKKQFERDYLVQLLQMTGGNVSEAARVSGRNRSDLYKVMKRHGLDSEAFKERDE